MRTHDNSLTVAEAALIEETRPALIVDMDEDALATLHARIRRARDKHVDIYRQEASARVTEMGGRGAAAPKNTRNAIKAEIFEEALNRVGDQLALRAAQTPAEPSTASAPVAERHAEPPKGKRRPDRMDIPLNARRPQQWENTPAQIKHTASAKAHGARRQAKRDQRSG